MAVCTDDDFIFDLCLDIEVGCTCTLILALLFCRKGSVSLTYCDLFQSSQKLLQGLRLMLVILILNDVSVNFQIFHIACPKILISCSKLQFDVIAYLSVKSYS